MNASSEGEIRVYYDLIHAHQEYLLRAPIGIILDLCQIELWGDVDPDITFDFVKLYEMTEVEAANVRSQEAQTDVNLIQAGVISPEESRKRIAEDPDTPYVDLDPLAMPVMPTEPEEEDPADARNATPDQWANAFGDVGRDLTDQGRGWTKAFADTKDQTKWSDAMGKLALLPGGIVPPPPDPALNPGPLMQPPDTAMPVMAQDDFDPGEPRDPKGSPHGGEWTAGGSTEGLTGSKGHPMLVSTRNATAKGTGAEGKAAVAEAAKAYHRIDLEALHQFPEQEAKVAKLFENGINYPGLKPDEIKGDTAHQIRATVDRMKDNLRALYETTTPEERNEWKGWYEGAHSIAERAAKKYGIDIASASGVYASLSPQKVWDANVYLGDRVMEIVKNHADERWDGKMVAVADGWLKGKKADTPRMKANLDRMHALFSGMAGKRYSDLTTPYEKAWWVRAYDEANSDRHYKQVGINGELGEEMKNANGAPSVAAWQTADSVGNAIKILESGGDREVISKALGDQHKVRSFYNNIVDPDSDNGDVTIDTHAVGAAWLRPHGGTSTQVVQALGSSAEVANKKPGYEAAPGSAVSGIKGTYPLYAQAYRELADELKLRPRQLQSILWEAKIGLFKGLKDATSAKMDEVWQKFHDDPKMKLADAHKQVFDALKGAA